MDAGFSSIVWCSVADPYAIMMTADGTLMLLKFTCDTNSTPNLTVSRVQIDQVILLNFDLKIKLLECNTIGSENAPPHLQCPFK